MRKAMLLRKVNTTAHGVRHRFGGDFRDDPRSEEVLKSGATRLGMHGEKRRGLDYTPLFRFLLSKVRKEWSEVHAEAVSRLDRPEPIFWMVALRPEDEKGYFRSGESSYFSGLRVDEHDKLQLVDPLLGPGSLAPLCKCCTHTFNGVRFARMFDPELIAQRSALRVF